jgi:hypothetical protein
MYTYDIARDENGHPRQMKHADGTPYFNVVSIALHKVRNQQRIVARVRTIEKAFEAVDYLNGLEK